MAGNNETGTVASRPAQRGDAFFVHVGSFGAVFLYFGLLESAGTREEGVFRALPVALAVMTIYVLIARSRGLLKHFDFGLWPMFAIGTAGVYAGSEAVLSLFASYSGSVLFTTLGLVAALPPLLGFETFTMHFARRTTPKWQLGTPEFSSINKIITAYFAVIFFTAAGLAAWEPHNFYYSVVYPNLLIFVAGIPSQFWMPPLYMKLVPISPPQTVETAIMGMTMTFDREAGKDAEATIQFRVSGADAADYYLKVSGGVCEGFEGTTSSPNLTIDTPDDVWLAIARGELDGAQAFQRQSYKATGDLSILMRFDEWFPRPAAS